MCRSLTDEVPMPCENIIEIRNLCKEYKGGIKAVNNISIDIKKGEVFGFLGPNGAGKSTTISMITTLLTPSSGSITVCGCDTVKQADMVRHMIGLVPQSLTADEELSGRENMRFHADLYNVPREIGRKRIEKLIELMHLTDAADRKVETYSGGMRKRLELAEGLIHRPQVLFLDEPTLGLDIQTREIIWNYIRRLREESGMTVFLTTHYLEEADLLCDRIAIIDEGRISILGTPDELKASLGGDTVFLSAEPGHDDEIAAFENTSSVDYKDGNYHILSTNSENTIRDVLAQTCEKDWKITSVYSEKPDLNKVFLKYVHSRENTVADKFSVRKEMGNNRRRMR